MTTDTVLALVHSGAYLPCAIVAAYLLLRWASTRFAALEGSRAHYVTAVLAALAVLAVPAAGGATPNASTLLSALGAVVALLLPGLTPAPAPKTPQSGRARVAVLLFVAASLALAACSWFRGSVEPDVTKAIDCAKTQVTIANAISLAEDVAADVAAGTIGSSVDALIVKYGEPVVACYFKAQIPSPVAPTPGSLTAVAPDPFSSAIAAHHWTFR